VTKNQLNEENELEKKLSRKKSKKKIAWAKKHSFFEQRN